ncbi:acyl-CoA dehydrogenase [Aeromicrobium sp. 636]|uniref:Acyl-CoA dehydrogenase family protein n=1 Tax=Aeromicrobium senzhongii TaxID=2663859 RepID=A0A8I0K153_9ACTN|nr:MULTISPECIES: acyl-CoA dehydrogenase family protein [Aeromicrobium]MBC9227076.1 acyl-CoA dehydrogenase family protein [Aeromicrobium senzhongii]MCQ3999176.1 acyl-CoA dehydrogenase [Aeromicrobium sp. 636]MTB89324.1 acyl-CoA dehydrogenase [Aeromicrobium senzhongii]QNL94523.1 acyl-CoA dehydrogenase family protein [Aeromicrobium senzhongii]
MDFTIDSEQKALVKAVRGLITNVYDSSETRREATATDPGFTAWEKLAEMGVLSLPFEASPVEVSLAAEELGKVIAPDPFVEAIVLAGGLIDALGTDEQKKQYVDAVAGGEILPILAWMEPGRRWSADASSVTFADGVLNGVKAPVVQAERADLLLVTAALPEGGTGVFLVEGATAVETTITNDGGRAATVTFGDTPAVQLGEGGDQTAAIESALDRARIAYAHEALGAMETALTTTVGYLKTRKQFGVTLNTFQALNHRAADMYVTLELARSTIMWATIVAADEDTTPEQLATAASHAALQTSVAGKHIGLDAIQLHGGIGMTAEYSVGHYASRLIAIEHLIGDADFHRARLAATVGDHDVFDPIG